MLVAATSRATGVLRQQEELKAVSPLHAFILACLTHLRLSGGAAEEREKSAAKRGRYE